MKVEFVFIAMATVILTLIINIVIIVRMYKKSVFFSCRFPGQQKVLRKQGFLLGYGNYNLRYVLGKWYAVKDDGKSLTILGLAEEIFPGILSRLEKNNQVLKVKNNEPLTLLEGMTTGNLILEKAEFTKN